MPEAPAATPTPPLAADGKDSASAGPSENPAAGQGAARRTPRESPQPRETEYLVYEVTESDKGTPLTLRRVGKGAVKAEDPTAARWAAVDDDEEVKKRADADAEGKPPALIPIPVGRVKPTPTREEKIVERKRA